METSVGNSLACVRKTHIRSNATKVVSLSFRNCYGVIAGYPQSDDIRVTISVAVNTSYGIGIAVPNLTGFMHKTATDIRKKRTV